jgi:hypothetical protein
MIIFYINLVVCWYIKKHKGVSRRSPWPRGLRPTSTPARLLRLWVRIQPEPWKFVCCECCVMPGRGLCDELMTRPEESYRLWCGVVCDLETSWMRRPWPTGGCRAKNIINEIRDDNKVRLVNFPQYPKIMLLLTSETQTYWHSQLQVVSFWTHDTKSRWRYNNNMMNVLY